MNLAFTGFPLRCVVGKYTPKQAGAARISFALEAARAPRRRCRGTPVGRPLRVCRRRVELLQVLEDVPRRVSSRAASEAGAWMCAGAAEVQPLDRRAIAGPVEQRTHREDLVQRQLAVEDVAGGEGVGRFQILRRDHLALDDKLLEVGGVFR